MPDSGYYKVSTGNRNPRRPPIAAPSCVWPAGVAENCARLAGLVDEVGLCLFETKACLAYSEEDLPASLAGLPLSYHAHLPLDLPWEAGFDAAWAGVVGLAEKIRFLRPRSLVLHPPPEPGFLDLLARRLPEIGFRTADVLLENVRECDLIGLLGRIERLGFAICLDLGHVLAYHQAELANCAEVWDRVRMIHASAPGPPGAPSRHRSLSCLDGHGRALFETALDRAGPETVLTLELFQPDDLLESLALARDLLDR